MDKSGSSQRQITWHMIQNHSALITRKASAAECKVVNAATCNHTLYYCLYRKKKCFSNILLPGRRGWSVHLGRTARARQVSCGGLQLARMHKDERMMKQPTMRLRKGESSEDGQRFFSFFCFQPCYPNELLTSSFSSLVGFQFFIQILGRWTWSPPLSKSWSPSCWC
jgi:hypothetical protein